MIKNKILLIGLLLGLLFACSPMKPRNQKIGSNLMETFYLGEKGTQYFIKPINFKGTKNNKLLTDFTFTHNKKTQLTDSVTINFSILFKTKDNLGKIKKVEFGTIESNNIKVLFKEEQKLRLTTKITTTDFKKFLNSTTKEILVEGKENKEKYIPSSSTKKKMTKIKSLFELE